MKKIIFALLLLIMPIGVAAHEDGYNTYYDKAVEYLGLPGDCYYMATKYLRDVYDNSNFSIRLSEYKQVSYSDAQPGDVIYYSSCSSNRYPGGHTTHWAVYLGDGNAFHGNWQEKVIIDTPFKSACDDPTFYHLKNSNTSTVEFNMISLDDYVAEE